MTNDRNSLCPVCNVGAATPFAQIRGLNYWRCPTCLATFMDVAHLPERAYELSRYHLHQNNLDDPRYRAFLSKLANPLLQILPPAQNGLDYGCGPGPALAEMLREAGHNMRLYDPFFQPDTSALELIYDFITCTEVAEHFHTPWQEFQRLDALLKPGGFLAVMTCFQTDDASFANWHYRRDPTHVIFYKEETLLYLAEKLDWHCSFPCKDVALMQKFIR